jgi:hypothetical protein
MRFEKTITNVTEYDIAAEAIRERLVGLRVYLNGKVTDGHPDGTYNFTLRSDGDESIKFATLDLLSEVFKTKKMNIRSEREWGGYCSSCAYTEVVCFIDVIDATV